MFAKTNLENMLDEFTEDFFVVPLTDINEHKAGDLLMADVAVGSFDPSSNAPKTFIKLKNQFDLIPMQNFMLIHNLVNGLN